MWPCLVLLHPVRARCDAVDNSPSPFCIYCRAATEPSLCGHIWSIWAPVVRGTDGPACSSVLLACADGLASGSPARCTAGNERKSGRAGPSRSAGRRPGNPQSPTSAAPAAGLMTCGPVARARNCTGHGTRPGARGGQVRARSMLVVMSIAPRRDRATGQ